MVVVWRGGVDGAVGRVPGLVITVKVICREDKGREVEKSNDGGRPATERAGRTRTPSRGDAGEEGKGDARERGGET